MNGVHDLGGTDGLGPVQPEPDEPVFAGHPRQHDRHRRGGGTVMAYRTDTTELGDARRRVEELVSQLPGGDGERSFEEPWELRAFALAVAAYHDGEYEWSEFQLALIEAIRSWESGASSTDPWSYYARWLDALEGVLGGRGLLSGQELDERTAEVLATSPAANHHEARREPVAIDPAR